LTATFFIATSVLDGGRMWNDSIIEAVRRAEGSTLDTGEIGLGRVELGSEAQRGAVAERIIKTVKHQSPSERQRLVNALCERARARLPDDLMMSGGQVRQLAESCMEIGAHTQTHPILRNLDTEGVAAEIEGSKNVLEQIVGRPVRVFAYPNGRPGDDYTERDRQVVEGLGFYCAPSTRWGVATPESDIYQLPRFTPWDQTPVRWLLRLLSIFSRPA
jgi:peptidoglycan/xylan/chitin deacetylase (PgdA/CDA1 family)